MTENDKYGVQIDAETNLFKKKMQELMTFINSFGKKAEEKTTIMPNLNTDDYTKQIDAIQDKLDALKDVINGVKAGKIEGNQKELQKEYDSLLIKLIKLKDAQKEYNEQMEDTDEEAEKSSSILSKLFDKSIGKIKRFTFYLLGARSVFSLFMKYQSIYYQYNEQMQYQSELSQNAIALSLAPAFEFLGNMVTYASIGIAKFIELLTGVNVLSKVTTKGIRDYNKSLKETQTLASGIDEITNLSLPSGTGLASQYSALEEFQKKVAEVTKWFDDNEWIKKLAVGIKNAFRYIVDNWDKLKYLFLGLGIATAVFDIGIKVNGLTQALGTVGTLGAGTVGTGLTGLAGLLSYFTTLGVIAVGVGIIVTDAIKLAEMRADYERILEIRKELNEERKNMFEKTVDLINEEIAKLEVTNENTEEWEHTVTNIQSYMDTLLGAIKAGGEGYEDYIPVVEEIGNKIEELTGKDYTAEIELSIETGKANEQMDSFWGKVKTGLNGVLKALDLGISGNSFLAPIWQGIKGSAIRLGLYANGLDYVPYDEYPAILHKGEAVVPAKYNPTIHSQGNEYTNSLLETLVMKMDDLANRPNVFEVDGNEFAKATYPLYRSEQNRQNYNAKVSVR